MYFIERAHEIAHKVDRIPINWEEVSDKSCCDCVYAQVSVCFLLLL